MQSRHVMSGSSPVMARIASGTACTIVVFWASHQLAISWWINDQRLSVWRTAVVVVIESGLGRIGLTRLQRLSKVIATIAAYVLGCSPFDRLYDHVLALRCAFVHCVRTSWWSFIVPRSFYSDRCHGTMNAGARDPKAALFSLVLRVLLCACQCLLDLGQLPCPIFCRSVKAADGDRQQWRRSTVDRGLFHATDG